MAPESAVGLTAETSPRALTAEQQAALSATGTSVALSAGAGCGKTFVLTQRLLAELEPDATGRPRSALGQIVAITFTERAAREMRDRIRRACGDRLRTCPTAQVDYWLGLVRELDTARISTIHSFCQSLLRRQAVEAGLDPRFTVVDESMADTLRFAVLDNQLRRLLADGGDAIIDLVVRFGLDGLRDMIQRLLGRRGEIDFARWAAETPAGLAARWQEFWRTAVVPGKLAALAGSKAARQLLALAQQAPCDKPKMRERFAEIATRLPNLANSADFVADLAALREAAKVQGVRGKDWADEADYAAFRDAAGEFRKATDRLGDLLAFDAAAALPTAEAALRLLAVTRDVAVAYDREKAAQAVLDFDDLLIRARDLLIGPGRAALCRRVAGQIRLLLVDECQDTDPLQIELVKALCGDEMLRGKLFFVGDQKQSIYRFRGAQPQVFRELRGEIPAAGRLPLSLNFRSQPAILEFVNALFTDALGPDYEPLRAHRSQLGPRPGVEFLWAVESPHELAADRPAAPADGAAAAVSVPADDDLGPTLRLRRREADWIARRIRVMLDASEQLVCESAGEQVTLRAVRPGDIVILFRALTNVEFYEDALRRWGIDYYLVGGKAFYSQQEIYDLVNLLQAIDNPADAVSLLGVLRSPLFSLDDETLFWLGQHRAGLGTALWATPLPAPLTAAQRRRVAFAAATLGELRAVKDRLPVAKLIATALDRTGYDAALLAEFLGERKLANLQKLIEQARNFDEAGIFTLSDFITQLSEFVVRQPDEALAATQPEAANVVRLMSIHQAKGLEFPVVIVADCDRRKITDRGAVAFTPQLGPMVRDEQPSGLDLHAAIEAEEDAAETLRLLYVAATRAADYLILSTGTQQVGDVHSPWLELLNERFDVQSGATQVAVPGIGAGTLLARVTTTPPAVVGRPKRGLQSADLGRLVDRVRTLQTEPPPAPPRLLAAIAPQPAARRQYSFSRLTGKLAAPRQRVVRTSDGQPAATAAEVPATAAFADDDQPPPVDPRGLGTLVHAVLAEVDFADPSGVRELIDRYAPQHLPDADSTEAAAEMIERFLASPRTGDLVRARQIHRELEFLLAWPPERYLQGFVDCLYEDRDGGWRLLDYKTNRVSADEVATAAQAYEMQMLLYGLAAERILKTSPVELTLCFLRPAVEFRFPWDDAARRRAAELVDAALAAAEQPASGR